VARRLHFRKAAEALAIAQPALSRQIAQLEAALGVRLLNRSSRRVELTPAGAAFWSGSSPSSRPSCACPADMKAVSEGRVGRLRVAFTGLAMATVLPDILRGFHRRSRGSPRAQ
jgi:DNA-binding transcriptional LysR family regulator